MLGIGGAASVAEEQHLTVVLKTIIDGFRSLNHYIDRTLDQLKTQLRAVAKRANYLFTNWVTVHLFSQNGIHDRG